MKMYSADAVTKADIDVVDAKQSRQIKQLKIWCGVLSAVAVLNLILVFAR